MPLTYAEKYNWWTPHSQKKNISLDMKISYLLESGTLDEIKEAIREIGILKIREVWEKETERNKNAFKKRKHLLACLMSLYD